MTWDTDAIQICKNIITLPGMIMTYIIGFFYRQSIPPDVIANAPDPSGWGPPASSLTSEGCDIGSHFADHQFVFGERDHRSIS